MSGSESYHTKVNGKEFSLKDISSIPNDELLSWFCYYLGACKPEADFIHEELLKRLNGSSPTIKLRKSTAKIGNKFRLLGDQEVINEVVKERPLTIGEVILKMDQLTAIGNNFAQSVVMKIVSDGEITQNYCVRWCNNGCGTLYKGEHLFYVIPSDEPLDSARFINRTSARDLIDVDVTAYVRTGDALLPIINVKKEPGILILECRRE